MQGSLLELPAGYYLERDPDVLILRRLDDSMVGAFSARGAAPEAILRAVAESVPRWPSADRGTSMPIARSALRVRFFDHFELLCDGEAVPLGRNGKALTILKYLLAHRSRAVSQDHLMGWLWPESNLKKARWSLNSAIRGVRKLLSCSSSATVDYILLEEGYYRLGSDVRVATDVEEFDEHYRQGRRLEKAHRMEEAAAEYEKAIELYRGDYLIEDLYEDWTMVERERLANAYVDMLDRLAAHYYDTGQFQESLRTCFRLLKKDPCFDSSHRLVMECYARLGLFVRALRHYQSYQHMLQHRLNKEPSAEIHALYRSILGE
jgi:DNA-binding SARP family transcriptional activator